jgi:hypothetical protein
VTTPTELLERNGPSDAGEITRNSSNRLRQDGTMHKQPSPSDESATLIESAARRPQRIALQFAIEVCGFDRCGRYFTERSETCNVSAGGCKFHLRTEVEREAVVALRVIERFERGGSNAAPVLFQVAHMERESSGWSLGAMKLRADDFWPMQMAPAGGAG